MTAAQVLAASGVAGGAASFVSLEKAVGMSGVRVTMWPGAPAIYAEALKNLLDAKAVPYTRVAHPMIGEGDNQEFLNKLTAQKSLPVMFYDDERPRSAWVEQVVLADKLGRGPSLIPTDPQVRVAMFGMLNELLSEDGIVWNKRLLFGQSPLTAKYGWSEEAAAQAPKRVAASLSYFLDQLRRQRGQGSRYLLGSSLTALDIFFATVSYMFVAPRPDIMPRTKQNDGFLAALAVNPPEVQALVDGAPWLVEYRDYILKTHCVVPAVLGGDPL